LRNSDPLKWWKDWKLVYPLLTKLIKKRYSMAATSVPLERFSVQQETLLMKKEVIYFQKMQTS